MSRDAVGGTPRRRATNAPTPICENCNFFQTSIEFRPTLQAQHDDAAAKGHHHRTDLYARLLNGLTEGEAS